MWRLGFFLHEMGFGLLSIFLPLYVITIGGSLFYIGLLSSLALLVAIPASFFWGYICDKTRHYKRYILLAFLASTAILYLFTFAMSLELLMVLYAIMSVFHMAHEPPKNVLISELYSRKDWDKSFAFYEGLTEMGWLIGLVLGFLASAFDLGAVNTLLLCSLLNLAALIFSALLVSDPSFIFERGLVTIERSVDFATRGVSLATRMFDGIPTSERLKRENVKAFGLGLILFSLATSILFTPMPIFVSRIVSGANLPQSIVFAVFILSSGGAITGYFLSGGQQESSGKSRVARVVVFRTLLTFMIFSVFVALSLGVILIMIILMLMGFFFALFTVYTLSLSMELIPAGQSGMFNVLIGIGGAAGSFVGPCMAEILGFPSVFLAAGVTCIVSYIVFRFYM
jgi:MFS family permease